MQFELKNTTTSRSGIALENKDFGAYSAEEAELRHGTRCETWLFSSRSLRQSLCFTAPKCSGILAHAYKEHLS